MSEISVIGTFEVAEVKRELKMLKSNISYGRKLRKQYKREWFIANIIDFKIKK